MLSRAWPGTELVTLAGLEYQAGPYRLRDLADLERWAAGRLQMTPPVPADGPGRRAALAAAYEAAERGCGGLGSPEIGAALASPEGTAVQLWLGLRRHNPGLDRADCLELAERVTLDEWDTFARVAWAVHPLDALGEAIDREIGAAMPRRRGPADPAAWGKSLWAVIEATGWTLEQLGELTLPQWDVVRTRGEARHGHCDLSPEDLPPGVPWRLVERDVVRPRSEFWREFGAKPA